MTENTENATRGVAYQESVKRKLRETIKQKEKVNKQLEDLDSHIYSAETAYLESTNSAGNILRGFEHYVKNANTSSNPSNSTSITNTSSATVSGPRSSSRRQTISDADRLFSRSSVQFMNFMREGEGIDGGGSAMSTPSQVEGTPTTPKAAGAGAAMKKGNKKGGDDDEEGDGKPAKRLKITYSRDKGD